MARNSFAELLTSEDAPISPLPPAIDVQARYQNVPARPSPFDDPSAELDDLTGVALSKLREILNQPTDWDQLRMVQTQASAAVAVMNVQVKVDEGRLRRRKVDILPKLLELIAAEEGKLTRRSLVAASVVEAEVLT